MKQTLRLILYIAIYVLSFIIQFAFINNFSLFGIRPNIMLCCAAVSFFVFNPKVGTIFSMITGIIFDTIYMTNGFGFYTLIFSLIGIVMYIISLSIVRSGNSSVIYLTIVSSCIFEIISYFRILLKYGLDIGIFRMIFGAILFFSLNIAFSLIIYNILKKATSETSEKSLYIGIR